jgi:RimJ/RimL family protein N-acetyltransferase
VKLREHDVVLRGERVVLRPMTEGDWDTLLKWNSDAEVLYYSEGDDVASYSLEDIQGIYRGVSQSAFCFIIELDGRPIGECWLQQMNLERILRRYPERDCRRIDLMIGEKHLWGRGLGTDVIRTLTRFGFEEEAAYLIFGCGISHYNPRSLGAFQRVGYEVDARIDQPPGRKSQYDYDVVMSREGWRSKQGQPRCC